MLKKMYEKLSTKTRKGFDGLIVTIGLILLVMILIFVFKDSVAKQIDKSIKGVATEIEEISAWDTGLGNN